VNRRTRENKQGTGKYYGCSHCYRYYGNYQGHHFNVTDTLQIAAAMIIETFGIAGSSLHVLYNVMKPIKKRFKGAGGDQSSFFIFLHTPSSIEYNYRL
jgi:hypothetical protein